LKIRIGVFHLLLLHTQIAYRRLVKTKGLLNYHYAQFRDLVEELVTTDLPLRVPRSLAKLLLPSLVEPYFEHREVIPGVVPHRIGRTWMITQGLLEGLCDHSGYHRTHHWTLDFFGEIRF